MSSKSLGKIFRMVASSQHSIRLGGVEEPTEGTEDLDKGLEYLKSLSHGFASFVSCVHQEGRDPTTSLVAEKIVTK